MRAVEKILLVDAVASIDIKDILEKLSASCARCVHACMPEPHGQRAIFACLQHRGRQSFVMRTPDDRCQVCALFAFVDRSEGSSVLRISVRTFADRKFSHICQSQLHENFPE